MNENGKEDQQGKTDETFHKNSALLESIKALDGQEFILTVPIGKGDPEDGKKKSV